MSNIIDFIKNTEVLRAEGEVVQTGYSNSLSKSFYSGEELILTIPTSVVAPLVSVSKEVSQIGVTNNDWNTLLAAENFSDSSGITVTDHDVTITSPATTPNILLTSSTAGVIDTTFWTDINSVTISDNIPANTAIGYAISTDDGLTWVSEDGKEAVKNNGGTWERTENVTVESNTYSYSAVTGSTDCRGMYVKPDGTAMYVINWSATTIYQFNLTTPYDVSTAVSASKTYNYGAVSQVFGIHFKSDGTIMYIVGYNDAIVRSYNLSTPWDVNTASGSSTFSTGLSDSVTDVRVSFDGTKMFVCRGFAGNIYEYTLTTPWAVNTATGGTARTVSGLEWSLDFSSDGTKLISGGDSTTKTLYNVSTPWDLTTATAIGSYGGSSRGLSVSMSDNGLHFYSIGYTNLPVSQVTTTSAFDLYGLAPASVNDQLTAFSECLTLGTSGGMTSSLTDAKLTVGSSLSLAIYMKSLDNSTTPTFQGMSINYDATSIKQEALLGTDYSVDRPSTTQLRVKALSAINLDVNVKG